MHLSLLVAFVLSLGLATSGLAVTSKPLTKRQANKRTLDSASSSSQTSSASIAPACVPYSNPKKPGDTPKSCDQTFHASLALCSPSPPPPSSSSSSSSSSPFSAECAARAQARLATCHALCHPSSRQLAACAKGCAQVWILFRKDVCSPLGVAQAIEACGDVGDAQLYACQDICVGHLGEVAAAGRAEGRTASSSSASAPAPGGSYDDTASSTAEVMTDIQVGGTGGVLANTDHMKSPALKIISRKGA
ncbi:hypothetical protein BDZ88DRAFT_506946 [Geranomyces variabilis]|nr:hypothetical protein BDZ88DRAFT_506946 [Geranomyces variabilis]KAJ3133424.1 hypothetical protein HDU90_005743 [Geranomyces variabilis]